MDHNKFDYESDLLFPLKDFFKRNTSFNSNDLSEIKIPIYLYDMPNMIKKEYFEIHDKEVNVGCFGGTTK